MLIRPAELDGIRDGRIDLAFRRWDRPRLLVGTRMRTKIGLVEITSVDRVALRAVTAEDARRAGASSRRQLLDFLAARRERPVYRVGLRYAGDDPRAALRADAALDAAAREALDARLDRMDRSSRIGPWTRSTLRMIADRPAVRAPDLAASVGRETAEFKRDVRKLKELGLTESLEIGYRIAPRGLAYLEGR